MRWKLQVLERAVKSHLPLASLVRRAKRKVAGYEPQSGNIGTTFEQLNELTAAINRCGATFRGADVLEIGSGWFPIFGLLMKLSGAQKVYLTDIVRRIDSGTFATASTIVRNRLADASKFPLVPNATGELNRLGLADFQYLAPFLAANVPDGSLDLVVSRAVLEHIPTADLERLLGLLRPKLKSTGVMAHLIDNSDHYEHNDRSISRVNFLTWSARKHQLINRLAGEGENRLRHHEYAALFRRVGYEPCFSDAYICERTRAALSRVPVVAPYDAMSGEQIAALTSCYVLRLAQSL